VHTVHVGVITTPKRSTCLFVHRNDDDGDDIYGDEKSAVLLIYLQTL